MEYQVSSWKTRSTFNKSNHRNENMSNSINLTSRIENPKLHSNYDDMEQLIPNIERLLIYEENASRALEPCPGQDMNKYESTEQLIHDTEWHNWDLVNAIGDDYQMSGKLVDKTLYKSTPDKEHKESDNCACLRQSNDLKSQDKELRREIKSEPIKVPAMKSPKSSPPLRKRICKTNSAPIEGSLLRDTLLRATQWKPQPTGVWTSIRQTRARSNSQIDQCCVECEKDLRKAHSDSSMVCYEVSVYDICKEKFTENQVNVIRTNSNMISVHKRLVKSRSYPSASTPKCFRGGDEKTSFGFRQNGEEQSGIPKGRSKPDHDSTEYLLKPIQKSFLEPTTDNPIEEYTHSYSPDISELNNSHTIDDVNNDYEFEDISPDYSDVDLELIESDS